MMPALGLGTEPQSTAPTITAFSHLHPGESFMMRNWKALGFNALMLAAFSAGPVAAGPEDVGKDDKTPATAKDIAEIKKWFAAVAAR